VEEGDFVLLQVARLDQLKDHRTALRMMDVVKRRRPNARLLLIGEGPERSTIEDLLRRLHLGGHVRLVGLRTDVAHLLPGADAGLLTSISEGIPLTLIEAMAAGLPVVATRVGGNPEVVSDSATGLLAPAGDPAALAEQVLRLAETPELRQRLGEAGRQRARERFSEDRMLDDYQRLYRTMLTPRAAKVLAETPA
jgi:glycosyltransferase involved in cell wall biosynthesis